MDATFAGWHLTYDALVAPKHAETLEDVDLLRGVFLDVAALIGADSLIPPIFQILESGVVANCLLTTGHLSLRTWPEHGQVSFDVFSWEEFEHVQVDDFLRGRLHVETRSSHWLKRNWPNCTAISVPRFQGRGAVCA